MCTARGWPDSLLGQRQRWAGIATHAGPLYVRQCGRWAHLRASGQRCRRLLGWHGQLALEASQRSFDTRRPFHVRQRRRRPDVGHPRRRCTAVLGQWGLAVQRVAAAGSVTRWRVLRRGAVDGSSPGADRAIHLDRHDRRQRCRLSEHVRCARGRRGCLLEARAQSGHGAASRPAVRLGRPRLGRELRGAGGRRSCLLAARLNSAERAVAGRTAHVDRLHGRDLVRAHEGRRGPLLGRRWAHRGDSRRAVPVDQRRLVLRLWPAERRRGRLLELSTPP